LQVAEKYLAANQELLPACPELVAGLPVASCQLIFNAVRFALYEDILTWPCPCAKKALPQAE